MSFEGQLEGIISLIVGLIVLSGFPFETIIISQRRRCLAILFYLITQEFLLCQSHDSVAHYSH